MTSKRHEETFQDVGNTLDLDLGAGFLGLKSVRSHTFRMRILYVLHVCCTSVKKRRKKTMQCIKCPY